MTTLFFILYLGHYLFDLILSEMNYRYRQVRQHQRAVQEALGIPDEAMAKALAYAYDLHQFQRVSQALSVVTVLPFIWYGGFPWVESLVCRLGVEGDVAVGLVFFGILAGLEMLISFPLSWYQTFSIEAKHGFNRQTPGLFLKDALKGLVIGAVLGTLLLVPLMHILSYPLWWLWVWLFLAGFSVLSAWLFPVLLLPLFYKLTPLTGPLSDKITALAQRVGFRSSGIFVMDASQRSTHSNAFFAGMFGEKRIVLFDTLTEKLSDDEIVAVMAHELGHFKLNHIRNSLIFRQVGMLVFFYGASFVYDDPGLYVPFGLTATPYAFLVAVKLWWDNVGLVLSAVSARMSRRNEFQADAFAVRVTGDRVHLREALLKLREQNASLPVVHPVYSAVHYSHPPLVERLGALGGA